MISCCLIVKNEEKWLKEFFEHLQGVVAEFVVVDTGSTDKSIEIASDFGARVISTRWENDFSKARNLSLEEATQPWILVMDPDERLSPKALLRLKELTAGEPAAYSFLTRNYSTNAGVTQYQPCCGEYADFEKDAPGFFISEKIRFFPRGHGIHYVGAVHELVESTVTLPTRSFEEPVHHYGNLSNLQTQRQKRNLYIEAAKRKANDNPNDWKSFYEWGNELCHATRWTEAVMPLERAWELSAGKVPVVAVNLSAAFLGLGHFDKAFSILDRALNLNPNHHDLLLNLGITHLRLREFGQALKAFRDIIAHHPHSYKGYRHAGLVLKGLGDAAGAKKLISQSLEIFPKYSDALKDLSQFEASST